MKRTLTIVAAVLLGWLGAVSTSEAQVFIRAPFVRVGVGDGVYVRATFREPVCAAERRSDVWPAGNLPAAAGDRGSANAARVGAVSDSAGSAPPCKAGSASANH